MTASPFGGSLTTLTTQRVFVHQRRSRKKFSIVRNTKLEAGIALGGGAGGLRLKNENGVILSLHSTEGIGPV